MRRLDDEALLDLVQRETLRYFTDYAHPDSGMARERYGADSSYDTLETVASGGTGFGVMALIAGAHRGFITAAEARSRIGRICEFLEGADRFRGAFAHWMTGSTGKSFAFSEKDDGGDIVETGFLMMGLLTARQWLVHDDPALAKRLDTLWRAVRWDEYCPGPERMMWHWSPAHGWGDGLGVTGWHEALVAWVLAAGSPTHPIPVSVYEKGWKDSPTFVNGKSWHGVTLPLGPDMGGPLFFAHYSFLGLDPFGLVDRHADYAQQNRAHVLINRAHCIANPNGFAGYGPAWGLTACDGDQGYNAFSPTNDRGVIAPTGAIASMPYAPQESLAALRHYHEALGDRLWGAYGFRDSFKETAGWFAPSHLAIDQGPIVAMVENHRSGLLWRLFMSAPEVATGLRRLGFNSPHLPAV